MYRCQSWNDSDPYQRLYHIRWNILKTPGPFYLSEPVRPKGMSRSSFKKWMAKYEKACGAALASADKVIRDASGILQKKRIED